MTGTLQTLIDILSRVFAQLRVTLSPDELEELAVTIHRAMTGKSRLYHSLEHALGFWDPENPIQTLAGLYHDIVYHHVDMGYVPEIAATISPYLITEGEQTALTPLALPEDRMYHLVLAVFGFQPGRIITPEHGLNEFLSALFMNAKLQPHVEEADLLQMTLCIEATIPFRPADYFYDLENRVVEINDQFHLNLEPGALKEMIKAAVKFANIDVKNFATKDSAVLLDDTWKVLPELNIALRNGIYTVKEYRQALQKMNTFMCSLHPEMIFHRFEDTPPMADFEQNTALAKENLNTAQKYLQIKLLTAAVLEALAEVSGGDAPLSLLLGDAANVSGGQAKRIEDFLPEPVASHLIEMNPKLFHLLEEGSTSISELDLRNAPLSMFIYKSLDPATAEEKFAHAMRFMDGELTANEFLTACNHAVIAAIARAMAAMVPTRRERLLEYSEKPQDDETS